MLFVIPFLNQKTTLLASPCRIINTVCGSPLYYLLF